MSAGKLQPEYTGLTNLTELYPQLVEEVRERWQAKTVDDVLSEMPQSRVNLSGDMSLRYTVIGSKDADDAHTGALWLGAGITYRPETYVLAEVFRQVAFPDSKLVVFTNNSSDQKAYTLSKEEQETLKTGKLDPLSERELLVFDALGIDALAFCAGGSFGGTRCAGFGRYALQYKGLKTFLIDDAPNSFDKVTDKKGDQVKGRTDIQIMKAMLREGKHVPEALLAAELPVYDDITGVNRPFSFRLAVTNYALGATLTDGNNAINKACNTDTLASDVHGIIGATDATTVTLANASDSLVGSIEQTMALAQGDWLGEERMQHILYEGWHVTNKNPFTYGSLGRAAIDWHANRSIAGIDEGSLGAPDFAREKPKNI